MADNMIELTREKFANIANAIRSVNGDTREYTVDEMPNAIEDLGGVNIDGGYVANFYDENGDLIQAVAAKETTPIDAPNYACDAWFDGNEKMITFPTILTADSHFYAKSNLTYADTFYMTAGLNKSEYPYLLVYWQKTSSSNKLVFFSKTSRMSGTATWYYGDDTVQYTYENLTNPSNYSNLDEVTQMLSNSEKMTNPSTINSSYVVVNRANDAYYYSNFDLGLGEGFDNVSHFRLDVAIETVVTDPYALQSKTVTSNGTVKPDDGYYGLSEVVVDVSTIEEPIIESHSEVESIITDGFSYINTYICPNPNYSIEMEFKMAQIVENNWDFLFGCKFGDKSGIAARFDTGVGGTLAVKRSYTYLTTREWGITNLTRNDFTTYRVFKLAKNKAYLDDTLIYTFSTTTEANEQHYAYPLYLFTVNDSNTTYLDNSGYLDVKYVRLWDEKDNLILDLIPVVKNDGTVCMYNKVNCAYYYNAGTGTFTYSTEEDSSSITIEE